MQARQYFVLPAIGQVIYTASLVGGIGVTLLDHRYSIVGYRLAASRHLRPGLGRRRRRAAPTSDPDSRPVRAKMELPSAFDFFHPGVREMFRLMVPRLFNAALLYVSVFINRDLLVPWV